MPAQPSRMHCFLFAIRAEKCARWCALLVISTGVLFSSVVAHAATDFAAPQVGAIRWDAWFGGEKGRVGEAVETALAAEKWHYRLPFFAQVLGPDKVHIDGSSQEVMDQEIACAANAGLAYWAYCLYAEDDPMFYGIRNYLASSHRDKIKFSLITTPANFKNPKSLAQIRSLILEKGYLTVLHGRPVLFLGFISDEEIQKHWAGDAAAFRSALDDFRSYCKAKGLENPYLVIMDFRPSEGKKWVDALGADALTSYATHGNANDKAGSYAELSQGVQWFWEQCKTTGAQVVPIVVTGGDRRPRVEHPVFWEKYQKQGDGIEKYFTQPKPEEIGAQMGNALRWIKTNQASAQAQLILTYAWNENDEGGWLVPTLSEGSARLNAVGKAIKAGVSAPH